LLSSEPQSPVFSPLSTASKIESYVNSPPPPKMHQWSKFITKSITQKPLLPKNRRQSITKLSKNTPFVKSDVEMVLAKAINKFAK